jgi:predicted house-cleaning noncanonical NTP pyrophosphatase (MazG superfamily)
MNKNKLVRDNILEIIKSKGQIADYEILDDVRIKEELLIKLFEECNEFKIDKNIEELADILEVIDGIITNFGFNREELEEVKKQKLTKNGGFQKRIFLKTVN